MVFSAVSVVSSFEADEDTDDLVSVGEKTHGYTHTQLYAVKLDFGQSPGCLVPSRKSSHVCCVVNMQIGYGWPLTLHPPFSSFKLI